MPPLEWIAIMIFVPVCVFFSWRAGFKMGSAATIWKLRDDGYLSQKALKILEAAEAAEPLE